MKKLSSNRLLALILTIVMVFTAVPMTANAVSTNADGYIEVRTVEELYSIRNDLTAKYILMNDIDLTEATAKGGDWDFGGRGWNPIGSGDTYYRGSFSGIFDGNGYSVIGMRIETTSSVGGYVGLFSSIAKSGVVKNLTMKDAYVDENKSGCAGIIAAENIGTVTNCSVSGRIEGNSYTGGIVGVNNGVIEKCRNTANVFGTSGDSYCGGIAGSNNDTIKMCYNTGKIKSTNTAGGIAGVSSDGETYDCYNVGDVVGADYAGGIVGYSSSTLNGRTLIHRCYNVGKISNSSTSNSTAYAITYRAGNMYVSKCYFLAGCGGRYYTSGGETSLTETQALLQSVYSGFDFDTVWVMDANAAYPYPQLRENIQDMSEGATLASIVSVPTKTEYMVGEEISFEGGMVKVVYKSGREELLNITADIASGYDMNTVGEQTVTVSVAGLTDTFTINVKERPAVKTVTVVFQPDKKVFTVGTAFDFTGAKAEVKYEDGTIEYIDITTENTTGGDINHIGKQTITFTHYGVSATFEVEVVGIAFESIELTSLPDKLVYLEGEELDTTGMVVTAVMNNGMRSPLATGYTLSGYSSTPGKHTVTIGYRGKALTFDVTVTAKSLVSIALISTPTKLEYISGQAFDPAGMVINATYDNGDVEPIEEYTVSGFDGVPGVNNVIITVGEHSVSFPVKTISRVIAEFKIASLPSKLQYIQYDSIDTTGLKVEATYNDGLTEEIKDYTLIASTAQPGTQTVTIAYEGFVETFDINVAMRYIENIRIVAPHKVTYLLGEEFDDTGMQVIAIYNNGQETPVDGYTMSGFDSSTVGTKQITVKYESFTRTFAVSVTKKTAVQTTGVIKAGQTTGRLGETVEIPVSITQNPGLSGFCHTITFDASGLTFVSATANNGFANGTLIVNDEKASMGQITVLWFSATDVKDSKTAYTLTFKIADNTADGDYEIGITYDDNDNGNALGQDVIFTAVNGKVNVISYWLGDLDGDRICEMSDLLQLAQYVSGKTMSLTAKQFKSADVNEDGTIDIHDVTLLSQWLLTSDM